MGLSCARRSRMHGIAAGRSPDTDSWSVKAWKKRAQETMRELLKVTLEQDAVRMIAEFDHWKRGGQQKVPQLGGPSYGDFSGAPPAL